MLLSELCHIYSGYTTRGRLEPTPAGGLPAIMLRDLSPDGEISSHLLHRYQLPDLPDRYLVHGGEVIFRSRGAPNTASVVGEYLTEPAAVILPLIILRPDLTRILPQYLAWAINQPQSQRRLDGKAQGTSLRMVSKADLECLDIHLPPLEIQRQIVAIHKLSSKESSLLRELATRRELFTRLILDNRVNLASQQGHAQ